MTEDQYFVLCEKYLKGDCTPEEEILIKNYQETLGLSDDDMPGLDENDRNRIRQVLYNRLQASINNTKTPVVKLFKWQYAAAATLLVALSIGVYLSNITHTKQPGVVRINKPVKKDIQPGTNRAILTLASGKHIVLDDAQNGILSKQGNAAISKSGNGIVIKNIEGSAKATAIALNTITIPRGGKYNITLPDGTKVWLNSSSALTFPTEFRGNERKISISGEAYFEVAKNKNMPFKIDVNNKEVVEVLGTHFNINAYTDEAAITTTLLEGSVKINYRDKATLIKPGQMAINNLGSEIVVKPANIDEVMAWRNDLFIFNNENITTIMKKISRWYDVDVVFKGNMAKIDFDGNYSRAKSLESLLKNIELVDKVNFKVEERRITVIAK